MANTQRPWQSRGCSVSCRISEFNRRFCVSERVRLPAPYWSRGVLVCLAYTGIAVTFILVWMSIFSYDSLEGKLSRSSVWGWSRTSASDSCDRRPTVEGGVWSYSFLELQHEIRRYNGLVPWGLWRQDGQFSNTLS